MQGSVCDAVVCSAGLGVSECWAEVGDGVASVTDGVTK